MKRPPLSSALLLFAALPFIAVSAGGAELEEKTVRYSIGDTTFESVIVFDPQSEDPKPGILMIPNWLGPTNASLAKARQVAGDDYTVMMVDMYGVDTRPTGPQEASAAAGAVRADRAMMRKRAQRALDAFRAEAEAVSLDPNRVAAIGFCFGGGAVLELGRSGADLAAIVSFHGDLASPTLEEDAGETRASVLVLHGADDPYVPQKDARRFVEAMRETDVDWQFVQYGNTVHSFTDPAADSPGQAQYHPLSAARAFEAMRQLFDEIWGVSE